MKKRVQCDILHMLHWLFFSIEKGVNSLGKNIKGKECGQGIFQRKDGWYIARFVDKRGTRHEKYFKTLAFRHKQKDWRAGPPKTQHSYRTIPLTSFAYEILQTVYENSKSQKRSETLSQQLEYIDRHTGAKTKLVMNDLVFINW